MDSRQGKRRDFTNTNSRGFLQGQPQMGMNALESTYFPKVSRLERQDDRESRHQVMGVDDLHLTMQAPLLSKCPDPHSLSRGKADSWQKWDSSRPVSLQTGMFGTIRTGQMCLQPDKVVAHSSRDDARTPPLPLPPADEGSRTGLRGSGSANLLNSGSGNAVMGTACPDFTPGRSKMWSQNTGLESTFVASQQITASSRQLTIFYGGQAHVFDDVPPDKAEAIMTLAGSSGRSWSTTYSPRPKASLPLSASEGSPSNLRKERGKCASRSNDMNDSSSLALSTEIHNVLANSARFGQGNSSAGRLTKLPSDMQITADCIGSCSKRHSTELRLVHLSNNADGAGKELI